MSDAIDPLGLGSGVADALTSALLTNTVPTLLTRIDQGVVNPISQTLGLGFGGADVWANQRVCNAPILVP